MLLAEGDTQEAAEPCGDVVNEPLTIQHGDHIIGVRFKGRMGNLGAIVLNISPWLARDQPGASRL